MKRETKLRLVLDKVLATGTPAGQRARVSSWKRELATIEAERSGSRVASPPEEDEPDLRRVTASEELFALRAYSGAKQRGRKVQLFRHGWPDYMVDDGDRVYGVEVKKNRTERLRASQKRAFALLEKVGMRVFVWSPDDQDRLVEWRDW